MFQSNVRYPLPYSDEICLTRCPWSRGSKSTGCRSSWKSPAEVGLSGPVWAYHPSIQVFHFFIQGLVRLGAKICLGFQRPLCSVHGRGLVFETVRRPSHIQSPFAPTRVVLQAWWHPKFILLLERLCQDCLQMCGCNGNVFQLHPFCMMACRKIMYLCSIYTCVK